MAPCQSSGKGHFAGSLGHRHSGDRRKVVAANYTPKESRTPQQNHLLELSTEFTSELLDADEYVIGVPMHNWGPSSSFKLWVDHISMLRVTASGSKEILGKKQATFVISAGGVYAPGSADAPKNYLEPWLRTFFGYPGIKDMRFIVADGTRPVKNGTIDRALFLAPHLEANRALFAEEPMPI